MLRKKKKISTLYTERHNLGPGNSGNFTQMEEKRFYGEVGQRLERVEQKGCGVFILGDEQSLTGNDFI